MATKFDYSDQDHNDAVANDFERYMSLIGKFVIYQNKSKSDIKEAKKVVKKAIKHLRAGEYDKVYDLDKCDNYDYDEDEYF